MASEENFDLAELGELTKLLHRHGMLLINVGRDEHADGARLGQLYCPKCGDRRRMAIKLLYAPRLTRAMAPPLVSGARQETWKELAQKAPDPALLSYHCVQCDTGFMALIYAGPDGPDLAVLPSCLGGLSTPNTPKGVAYYLDQAYRAEATGARSAAMTMYRAALEHLLFEQGYTVRMLGPKIGNLRADIDAGTAPGWATSLEPTEMAILNQLGNGAIHPNDGDVSNQATFDTELLAAVKAAFADLLEEVYERPRDRAARHDRLKAATEKFGVGTRESPTVDKHKGRSK